MSRFCRLLCIGLFAAIVATGTGCPEKKKDPPKEPTPVEYFLQHQVNTMTPHGKIIMDGVEEKDGKIHYKTEDGKHWRVGYSKRADGTYEYRMPDEVK